MANKNFFWLRLLVMVLVFGIMVTGCSTLSNLFGKDKAPESFVPGGSGQTTIVMRPDLNFDESFRNIIFNLSTIHNYEMEMADASLGAIRTTYQYYNSGYGANTFRTRLHINFNPSRTQLILRVEAAILVDREWLSGSDTDVLELVRSDLNLIVGN